VSSTKLRAVAFNHVEVLQCAISSLGVATICTHEESLSEGCGGGGGGGGGGGATLFHVAAKWGSGECFALLLRCWHQYHRRYKLTAEEAEAEAGAETDTEVLLANMHDGTSPLHLAAR